jgi:peptidoglycan/xylan/chitin deacetylase (PgdA/CDA1 family)
MYHAITQAPAGSALPELFLPADQFDQQMRYLKAHDYHPVTLAQVWAYWTHGATLPVHPIVLSFDDGYRSQFDAAARTLHRYNWPGVLNLIVAHLHEGTYGLGARQVRRMIDWGWELDSHTLTHPDLTTVHGATLTAEVAGSRQQLQHEFAVPVAFFCYPAGAYDDEVVHAVAAAGYSAATTTNEGAADPSQGRFTLDRVRINGSTTVTEFAAELAGLASTVG